jgi:hypothetical protein
MLWRQTASCHRIPVLVFEFVSIDKAAARAAVKETADALLKVQQKIKY